MIKRFSILVIVFSLLLSVSGCGSEEKKASDAVQFYYIRSDFEYHSEENVIVAEQRELSGSKDDLSYMLTLYILGPTKEHLISPFPSHAKIIDVKEEDGNISITLSAMDTILSDSKFSLACGCLAMTVFGIKDCHTVSIFSGERSIILTKDSFTLNDQITQNPAQSEETQ